MGAGMFGQDDTKDDTQNETTTIEPTTDDTTSVPVTDDSTEAVTTGEPVVDEVASTDVPVTSDNQDTEEVDGEPDATTVAPIETDEPAESETSVVPTASATLPANNEELLELKKEALTDLGPLVSHLDQTPEEHFKTTMMLIQATDNATFVKEAYESAKKISDDAVRAQALLDIVNEINYFTQQHTDQKD